MQPCASTTGIRYRLADWPIFTVMRAIGHCLRLFALNANWARLLRLAKTVLKDANIACFLVLYLV